MNRILAILVALCSFVSYAEVSAIKYENKMTVDGFELDYVCRGVGEPVTVLEPPSGIASEEAFKHIFEKLAKTNKTCIYARLGSGQDSRAEGLDLSGRDYLRQLNELIRLEAKGKPLILVGYSYGSFVARLYASDYPKFVKGLILIDPPHHQWMQAMKSEMTPDDWEKMNGILSWFKRARGHNYWDTQFEVAESSLNPDLPVMLVARGLDELNIKKAKLSEKGFRQFNDFHFKYIKVMEKLTRNTELFLAPNSRHLILNHEPEVVVKAFSQLNKKIRTQQN